MNVFSFLEGSCSTAFMGAFLRNVNNGILKTRPKSAVRRVPTAALIPAVGEEAGVSERHKCCAAKDKMSPKGTLSHHCPP